MASTPTKDLGIVLLTFVGLGVLWVLLGRPVGNPNDLNSPFLTSPFTSVSSNFSGNSNNNNETISNVGSGVGDSTIVLKGVTYVKSPWYGQVDIGRGNASGENRPGEEYITLSASRRNKEGVSISGWLLENGRKFRNFEQGSNRVVQGKSAVIKIPFGAEIFLGQPSQNLHQIILKPDDRAIVTTGQMYDSTADIEINFSFKTNKCTGYLEDLPKLDFTPRLRMSCPDPEKVLGADSLPRDCYDFVKRLASCHTPDTEEYRDNNHELVRNHLDKVTGLSRYCRDWVTSRFSYNSCLNRHVTDEDFVGNEWRIFLNQSFELWDKSREVITLYDSQGRLVDQISY